MNRVKLQLILAVFWFVSAYLAVGALLPWEWAWRCAWLNLIIGLIALLLVTRTEEGERLFYIGPQDNEISSFAVALLWSVPMVVLCMAGIWWIMRLLGIFHW